MHCRGPINGFCLQPRLLVSEELTRSRVHVLKKAKRGEGGGSKLQSMVVEGKRLPVARDVVLFAGFESIPLATVSLSCRRLQLALDALFEIFWVFQGKPKGNPGPQPVFN